MLLAYGSLSAHFIVITALISIALHNVLLSGGEASMACPLDEKNPATGKAPVAV